VVLVFSLSVSSYPGFLDAARAADQFEFRGIEFLTKNTWEVGLATVVAGEEMQHEFDFSSRNAGCITFPFPIAYPRGFLTLCAHDKYTR